MYLDISCDLDVTEILKSLNVKIKQYSELLLDRIINYINVINEIFGIKYFVYGSGLSIEMFFLQTHERIVICHDNFLHGATEQVEV